MSNVGLTQGPSTKDVRQMGRGGGGGGGGVVLKFRTFPDGGRGVVCESSDVRKFLKNRNSKISQSSLKLKL